MRKFFKWYIGTWKKKNIDGVECIEMCYASAFIILFITLIIVVCAAIYNTYFK